MYSPTKTTEINDDDNDDGDDDDDISLAGFMCLLTAFVQIFVLCCLQLALITVISQNTVCIVQCFYLINIVF